MPLKIKTYFTIYGDDFNPDEIYNELGFTQANIWHKGEYRASSKLVFDDYGWSISTENNITLCLSELIDEILLLVEPKTELITFLKTKYSLKSEIACSIYLNDKDFPDLYLDNKILKRITNLGCALDIDLLG